MYWSASITALLENNMTTRIIKKRPLAGVSALIKIDRRSDTPLYRQIYDAFVARITEQELRAGELVHSSRELARELRISRIPVLNAYAQLMAEGFFETRAGAGTYIGVAIPRRGGRPTRSKAVTGGPRPTSRAASSLPEYVRPSWA